MNTKKISITGLLALLTVTLPLAIFAAPGDLDLSFGTNGFSFNTLGVSMNGGPNGNGTAIQPDGKLLIAGDRFVTIGKPQRRALLARYNSDGTLDTTFGGGGVIFHSNTYTLNSVAVQPDGKIIAGGIGPSTTFSSAFYIFRYNADGTSDTTFNNSGVNFTAIGSNAVLKSVLLQPDGKIAAAGFSCLTVSQCFSNGESFAVVRYNVNGSLDSSFDGDGIVTTNFENSLALASEIILQPDGKIVAAGTVTGAVKSFALARYNADGSLDTTFGNGGRVVTSTGNENAFLNSVALQSDGRIVVAGYSRPTSNYDFTVARYTSSGTLDSSFGTNGIVTTDFNSGYDIASKVLIQRNGKIVAVGSSYETATANISLARYNADGTPDANFGQAGKVFALTQQTSTRVTSALLQPDGKIVAAGDSNSNNGSRFITLARFIGDAAARPAFDFDGDGKTDISVFRGGVWHLQRSQFGFAALNWGVASDKPAPADFDGDGKTDLSVYRPSNGEWSVFNSLTHTITIVNFGAPEDLPRPADFDGDGKADICVWRPSTGVWYRLNSSNGQFAATAFGQNGDAPLIADFDGDGKSDIAVFRPSNGTWYWLNSSSGQFQAIAFGQTGDKPVQADYDGDGRTDISVFRPSNGVWYRLNSSNNSFFATAFGQAGDVPTPGDYDGDGRADIALFRPSNGIWYRLNSASGGFYFEAFGVSSDSPIPAAFVP